MTEVGQSLIRAAQEAAGIARGDGELKHDDLTAECDSGDGAHFYASMYPGGILAIEVYCDDRMIEIELCHNDAVKLAALVGRNTQS